MRLFADNPTPFRPDLSCFVAIYQQRRGVASCRGRVPCMRPSRTLIGCKIRPKNNPSQYGRHTSASPPPSTLGSGVLHTVFVFVAIFSQQPFFCLSLSAARQWPLACLFLFPRGRQRRLLTTKMRQNPLDLGSTASLRLDLWATSPILCRQCLQRSLPNSMRASALVIQCRNEQHLHYTHLRAQPFHILQRVAVASTTPIPQITLATHSIFNLLVMRPVDLKATRMYVISKTRCGSCLTIVGRWSETRPQIQAQQCIPPDIP